MTVKRLSLIGVTILSITACSSKPRDQCVAKAPDPRETAGQLKEAFGDKAERIGPWINLKVDYGNCLTAQAYATRRLSAPMEDVARAITAKCAPKFEMWHGVEAGSYGDMNDSLQAFLDAEKDGDRKEADQKTLALVLDYRSCAAGQEPNSGP